MHARCRNAVAIGARLAAAMDLIQHLPGAVGRGSAKKSTPAVVVPPADRRSGIASCIARKIASTMRIEVSWISAATAAVHPGSRIEPGRVMIVSGRKAPAFCCISRPLMMRAEYATAERAMNGVVLQKLEARSALSDRSKVASSPAMVILTNAGGFAARAPIVQVVLPFIDAVRQFADGLAHLDLRQIVQTRQRHGEDILAVLPAKLDDAPFASLGCRYLSKQIALARFRIPHIGLQKLHDRRIHARRRRNQNRWNRIAS